MSKNYREPASFFAIAAHEHMRGFVIQAVDSTCDMAAVIDKIRHINGKDPNFMYTCMCDDNITQWAFAYSDPDVCKEASDVSDEAFEEITGRTPGGDVPPLPHVACSCPLGA